MTQDLAGRDGRDPDSRSEAEPRAGWRTVLKLGETLLAEALRSPATTPHPRDELNRLQGEQAQPTVRSPGPPPGPTTSSAAPARRAPTSWHQSRQLDRITSARVARRPVDPRALLSDDAAPDRLVTAAQALRGIPEGRHCQQLVAHRALHREVLAACRTDCWSCDRALHTSRQQPSPAAATRLARGCATLVNRPTGCGLRDHRLARTRDQQDQVLLVLQPPELPLHTTPAEVAARRRVRKREVRFGPRSTAGAKARDPFMTLAATTQTRGISCCADLQDRRQQAGRIPPFADLLHHRAVSLNLSASGTPP